MESTTTNKQNFGSYMEVINSLRQIQRYQHLPKIDPDSVDTAYLHYRRNEGFTFLSETYTPGQHCKDIYQTIKIVTDKDVFAISELVCIDDCDIDLQANYTVGNLTWRNTYHDKCCYYRIFIPVVDATYHEISGFYGVAENRTATYEVGPCVLELEQYRDSENEIYLVINCNSYVLYSALLDYCRILFDIFCLLTGTAHFQWFCFFHHTLTQKEIAGMRYQTWHKPRANEFSAFGVTIGPLALTKRCDFGKEKIEALAAMAIQHQLFRECIAVLSEASGIPARLHCLAVAKIMACLAQVFGSDDGIQLHYKVAEIARLTNLENRWNKMLSRLGISLEPEEKTAILWAYAVSWHSDFGGASTGAQVDYKRLQMILMNILNTIFLRSVDHRGNMGDQTTYKAVVMWDLSVDFWHRTI
ncbi:hypothetical protein [Chitinophaga arvensicola]|uniref:Uncharacterized protein n=1 Tax=Chitinophaga arvensicola TaxID=29529 RepID=A0A1I0PR36_9BACT|nr:hypothetical protein [Chitinophaga arvensicola]SEW16763.1 hypothetical protein SAMN04488122_0921 [Chitinophaga arvensicola]